MKVLKAYFFISLILVLLSSSFSQDDTVSDTENEIEERVERFSSWEFGISFEIPENWQKSKKPGYLVRLTEESLGIEFSIKARLLSEKIPVDNFIKRMEGEMSLNEGYKIYNLKELLERDDFWGNEMEVPADKTEWKNPYESLLYDDEPSEEVLKKIKEKIEKLEEEEKEVDIEIPIQTEATFLYDGGDIRNIAIYIMRGNVGYVFKMTSKRISFLNNIDDFAEILKEVDVRHIYGGQYAEEDVVEIDVKNTGVISGKVLYNGMTVPDTSIYLYKSYDDYKKGNAFDSIKSNYVGEYWFVDIEPGSGFIIDARFSGDGGSLKSYKPIDGVKVIEGKVTFVNIELVQ
jgi:hypothetical protein